MNWNEKKSIIIDNIDKIELGIITIRELLETSQDMKPIENNVFDLAIIKRAIQDINKTQHSPTKTRLTKKLLTVDRWNYGYNKTLAKLDYFTNMNKIIVDELGNKMIFSIYNKKQIESGMQFDDDTQDNSFDFDTPLAIQEQKHRERQERQKKQADYKESVDGFIENYPSIIEITIRIQTSTKEKYDVEREKLKAVFIERAIEDEIDNPEEEFNKIECGKFL